MSKWNRIRLVTAGLMALSGLLFFIGGFLLEGTLMQIIPNRWHIVLAIVATTASTAWLASILMYLHRFISHVLFSIFHLVIIVILILFHSNLHAISNLSLFYFGLALLPATLAQVGWFTIYRQFGIQYLNKFRYQLLTILITVAYTVIFSEFILRASGNKPGFVENKYFHQVDSLEVKNDNYADEFGIQKFKPETALLVKDLINSSAKDMDSVAYANLSSGPWKTVSDFRACINNEVTNDFTKYMKTLKSIPDSLLTEVDKAYLTYYHSPLNTDGFRSIEMKDMKTEKTKILLIGDSFTWGWNCTNYTYSFSDQLSAMGYVVYNTGISATEPAQYEGIAHRYIDIVKPDIVIVNFFTGNDIMYYHRELRPHQVYYWETNAGVFYSYPSGVYIPNVDTAYEFVLNSNRMPQSWERILPKSILLERLMNGLGRTGLWYYLNRNSKWTAKRPKKPCVEEHMLAIKAECEKHGAEMLLSIIPQHFELEETSFLQLFPKLNPVLPSGFSTQDYNTNDGHFNDKGHTKYAKFLKAEVDRLLQDQ